MKPKQKEIKPRRGTALKMNLMMRGIFKSQSNVKIIVGGVEAMEPDLESFGDRREHEAEGEEAVGAEMRLLFIIIIG